MLERLSRGKRPSASFAAPFGVSLPAIQKHLRVLERAGLITHGQSAAESAMCGWRRVPRRGRTIFSPVT